MRLVRGDRSAEILYGEDPLEAARRWEREGAEWIHAIDLGGALGEPDNLGAIVSIARSVGIPVQAGGGLRDAERVDRLLSGGVERVILGTRALADPEFLAELLERHGPSRIVLAMDVAGGRVRVKGWEAESGLDLAGGLAYARSSGVEHLLLTAIDRDGTMAGASLSLIARALEEAEAQVVTAGGIGTLADLRAIFDLRHPRLEGAVVGRALYEGTVSLGDAVALSKEFQE